MKGFLAFPVLLFLLLGTLASADYQEGLEAYAKGDYATVLKECVATRQSKRESVREQPIMARHQGMPA